MSNPVFSRSAVFNGRTPAGYPQMPGYQPGVGTAGAGLENEPGVATPQATVYQTAPAQAASRPVTYDDILIKTAITFGVLLVAAAVAWNVIRVDAQVGMALAMGGVIGGFVLGLVNSFKSKPSPVLILLYAAFEGVALGAISSVFNAQWSGIVMQAILATLVTFLVMLGAFKTQLIRNSPTLVRVVTIGLLSIAAFYVLNFVLSFFMTTTPLQATIFGIPLWVGVSVLAIALAALSLITDFDYIKVAVERGAPAETAWTAAFGLMVTLVWLYLEFLRLLSYFSND